MTDYDVGIVAEGGAEPVTADEVVKVLHANTERVKSLSLEMIKRCLERDCFCAHALEHARLG